ncbi:MAG: hypothetical protein ACLT1T_08640 [Oscillospiraceae bacterium]
MLNSFVVAAATAILSTYFSALTAYGLHAYNFKLKRLAFLFIMAVMVIPKQVSAAGFVQLCYKLKLTTSYLPLILPSLAAPVVFFYMIRYRERPAHGDRGAASTARASSLLSTASCCPC